MISFFVFFPFFFQLESLSSVTVCRESVIERGQADEGASNNDPFMLVSEGKIQPV